MHLTICKGLQDSEWQVLWVLRGDVVANRPGIVPSRVEPASLTLSAVELIFLEVKVVLMGLGGEWRRSGTSAGHRAQ